MGENCRKAPSEIKGGAIFTEDQKNSSSELAFKYAVYKINKDREILPNTTLVYDIQYVPRDDSFRTSKKGGGFTLSIYPVIDLELSLISGTKASFYCQFPVLQEQSLVI
ncbi:hypothetical protein GWI33_016302 [Rhynchophorus ferrugineus]|uniref:Uncharacterized protein n=1 Tax=Rhynchophorus ferrugineus TaxID=354439 RepID=A0A834MAG3_RHYFE|nr:hypothetical protein GWI33_016302 [Rhynchophorus ferrugineus]